MCGLTHRGGAAEQLYPGPLSDSPHCCELDSFPSAEPTGTRLLVVVVTSVQANGSRQLRIRTEPRSKQPSVNTWRLGRTNPRSEGQCPGVADNPLADLDRESTRDKGAVIRNPNAWGFASTLSKPYASYRAAPRLTMVSSEESLLFSELNSPVDRSSMGAEHSLEAQDLALR